MNGYENLFLAIIPGLSKHYDISEYDFRNNPHMTSVFKCRTHLHHLVLIEMVLYEHRQKYRKSLADLSGVAALHHMVYQETKWTLDQITSLSISDLIFVLQDKLTPQNLSEASQNYLKTLLNNEQPPKIDLTSYADWQIGSGDLYLKYDR